MIKSGKISESEADVLFGTGNKVPEPVFFCSIEPPSQAYQSALDLALLELQREDPSLRVSHDGETGQTILAGMLNVMFILFNVLTLRAKVKKWIYYLLNHLVQIIAFLLIIFFICYINKQKQ